MPDKTAVFVLSSRRSGSTWTGYVLGSHSRAAFLGEYYRAWRPEISVPCSLCAAKGQQHCPVLGGIEEVPERDAFNFAFARVRKPVLVDASKDVDWITRFANGGFDIKVVHVLRDPRGYFSSERRRFPVESWPTLISSWVQENRTISDFVRRNRIPFMPVFYDNLARNPALFDELFRFVGLKPDSSALNYWMKEHHGFAANGASSLLLRRFSEEAYTTGDDAFYSALGVRNFHDQRWIRSLSPDEKASIQTNPDVIEVLAQNGTFMTEDGLQAHSSNSSRARTRFKILGRLLPARVPLNTSLDD